MLCNQQKLVFSEEAHFSFKMDDASSFSDQIRTKFRCTLKNLSPTEDDQELYSPDVYVKNK